VANPKSKGRPVHAADSFHRAKGGRGLWLVSDRQHAPVLLLLEASAQDSTSTVVTTTSGRACKGPGWPGRPLLATAFRDAHSPGEPEGLQTEAAEAAGCVDCTVRAERCQAQSRTGRAAAPRASISSRAAWERCCDGACRRSIGPPGQDFAGAGLSGYLVIWQCGVG
jgi:hypothetical protein